MDAKKLINAKVLEETDDSIMLEVEVKSGKHYKFPVDKSMAVVENLNSDGMGDIYLAVKEIDKIQAVIENSLKDKL